MNTWPRTDFQKVYFKKNFYNQIYCDVIMTGDMWGPVFHLREIKENYNHKLSAYKYPENIYQFFANDQWFTFSLEEVVFLNNSYEKEFYNKFYLKAEEKKWEKWDLDTFNLNVLDCRKKEDRNFEFSNLKLEFWEPK